MQQADNFKEYISAFEKELECVIIDSISPEPYCKKYLSHLLLHKRYYLAIYADVLQKIVAHSCKNKSAITLVDYGSGNGLLGIFARFCGFKKVILNDIDAKFVKASEQLAAQLNIMVDGYVTGGINDLQSYCKNEMPDAIAGTDVIEHIYDLEGFLSCLQQINESMVSVFTTGSNPANLLKVSRLKKIQMKDELQGGEPGDHLLFGENPLEPFLKIREQVIRKNCDKLTDKEIMDHISMATRSICGRANNDQLSRLLVVPPEPRKTWWKVRGRAPGWSRRSAASTSSCKSRPRPA